MAEFVIINKHEEDEHDDLIEEWEQNKDKLPASARGEVEYCSCPGGEHGGYFMVNAENEDAALALFNDFPKFKAGNRAVKGGRFTFE